ncbi:Uncharacterized membrane protein [Thiothrix caldifontis]|uniref:Uncharacterized membrane protein n=1 Tax=Thiothrix caldifontis TaxID=525918 RepID=A0A1H3XQX3_9GAMM|nr:DUF2254 domain-containing protein [Thiothrix caldifontis]SEA01733.1 Uncharacterized membrane protein [Thiothrix caldifontis]
MNTVFASIRRQFAKHLWIRPTLAALLSMGLAAFAYWFGQTFEQRFDLNISEDSLVSLLGTFASSMLSVATFTLAGIITAASSASNSTTPRASRLILADNTAQFVLSSFVAAFIYGFVSIFALKAFHYGNNGRFILFLGLIGIVSLVLVAFLRWVNYAMRLGRQSTTIEKLVVTAKAALQHNVVGTFGAKRWDGAIPADSCPVYPQSYGYVVLLNVPKVQALAAAQDCQVILATRPAEVADKTLPLAYITPAQVADEALVNAVRQTITLDTWRQAEVDVRYNLLNLAETADRALSPAVNDPGTAINILHVLQELLAHWAEIRSDEACFQVEYPAVSVLPLTAEELVNDSFSPIARDGAAIAEVGIRLQKVLASLTRHGDAELAAAARQMSATALEFAEQALIASSQRQKVRDAAAQVLA